MAEFPATLTLAYSSGQLKDVMHGPKINVSGTSFFKLFEAYLSGVPSLELPQILHWVIKRFPFRA